MNVVWTKELESRLRELWVKIPTLSTREIAAELNCGITKNSIIGKAHRLGLDLRKPSGGKKASGLPPKPRKPYTQWKPRPYLVTTNPPIPIEGPPGGLSLSDLGRGRCKAITSVDGLKIDAVRYCGAATEGRKSFCPGHEAIYYRPEKPRRERRRCR